MKIKDTDTCYICGEKATSSEHAPAKCFFPSDMRKNLIEVPSCCKHNERTSMDDEYVRFIIASYFRNNEIGVEHSVNKGVKTLKRSQALMKALTENKMPVNIIGTNGSSSNSMALKIDRGRFDNEIRKNAYALYYHKYGKRWMRALTVSTYDLVDNNGTPDELGLLILHYKRELKQCCETIDYEGDNPEVFKYAFMDAGDTEYDKILIMLFYEGFEIWVMPDQNTSEPHV